MTTATSSGSLVCSVTHVDRSQDTITKDVQSDNSIPANSSANSMDMDRQKLDIARTHAQSGCSIPINSTACSMSTATGAKSTVFPVEDGEQSRVVIANDAQSARSMPANNVSGQLVKEKSLVATSSTALCALKDGDNNQNAAVNDAMDYYQYGIGKGDKDNGIASMHVACAAKSDVDGALASDASLTLTPTAGMQRRQALMAKVTQNREAQRKQAEERQAFDDQTIDRISGLRIVDRLLPQQKWELCMGGKRIVPFAELKSIKEKGGRDQVVIGVLWKPTEKQQGPNGEWHAELCLANLDKRQNLTCSLVLMGRAKDHWVDDGPGRSQATVGSIFAVLNPGPTQRVGFLRINFETQLVKVGNSSALAHCSAMLSCGRKCSQPYNKEGDAGYCFQHATASPHARFLQCSSTQDGRRAARGNIQNVRPRAGSEFCRQLGNKRMRDGSMDVDPQTSGKASAGAAGLGTLLRAASAISEARSASEALVAIEALEAIDITAPALKRTKLYDEIGSAMTRHKGGAKLAEIAGRLRRRWRALLAEEA